MVVGARSKVGDNSSGGQVVSSGNVGSQPSTSTSGTDTSPSPGNVRQTLRDFWTNKFDGKISSTVSKPPETSKPSNVPDSAPKARCPICRAQVEESRINQHLDRCLESPPTEASTSEQSSSKSNPFVDDDDSDSKPCPVCGKDVLIPEMNHHLDLCIAANQ